MSSLPPAPHSLTRRHLLAGISAAITTTAPLQGPPLALAGRRKRGRAIPDVFRPLQPGGVKIEGWLGEKLELCLNNRVMSEDVESYARPFATRPESGLWDWTIEYWGKWFTSAVLGYAYQPTEEHRAFIDKAVRALLDTQTPDGQITTYSESHQYTNWDVWGRRYVILGLISHHDATGDEASLRAACRNADALVLAVRTGKLRIGEDGWIRFAGIQSHSIVNELAMLFERTGELRYRDLAKQVVASWDTPNKLAPRGLQLLSGTLAGKSALEIGKIGSPKCYEMLACFEGLCELYRATGDRRYFKAVQNLMLNVLETERMLHGSVSNNEEWFNGARHQTEVLQQPVETCATATWMNLCWQMLRFTAESQWADELELTLYNALLGAMTPDGRWWTYFTPLIGERVPSQTMHKHIGKSGISCCVTSGPRGLLLTPQWAVMASARGPVVNLYAPGEAVVKLDDGTTATIRQQTSYPESGKVKLTVVPSTKHRFTLHLRIPAWSARTSLLVNGKVVRCKPGTYAAITREWSADDAVELSLDLRGRIVRAPAGGTDVALMRGPIVLALDSRMTAATDKVLDLIADADGTVALEPLAEKPAGVWMAFSAPFAFVRGPGLPGEPVSLPFCDYQSAGNQFSNANQFRTWMPQPLAMQSPFPLDTWKLAYEDERPQIPANR